MRSLELFSGCGALALGLARAGFEHSLLVECDAHACGTVRHNASSGLDHVRDWPLRETDVRQIDFGELPNVELVAGGPPCQPFSIGGKHRGQLDDRDMWAEAVRAVRETRPRAFLFENVRGLVRPKFADYLDYVVAMLGEPTMEKRPRESVDGHRARLHRDGEGEYEVHVVKVNAADYGSAQRRHRVVIVGLRADFAGDWEPPALTHLEEKLLWDQYVTGEYWERHGLRPRRQPESANQRRKVESLRSQLIEPAGRPWVTVRDRLDGLPDPESEQINLSNHDHQPGARVYKGHTGSPLDLPAKALKAGDHGVPGGENMLVKDNGRVRYFTVREAARLQGLPDGYEFVGTWSQNMRQLGNAVPVELAEAFGASLLDAISTRRAAHAA